MFEKEIKFIVDFSLNKVKNLGSFFSYEKLLGTDIHPAILQYISAEIDFLISEDRKKLIQNSVFDYSGPEIAKYFNLIGEEVKRTKRISVEDIKKLVTQAVSFNVNYVSRPKWSLSKLIFNDSDLKPIDEIKLALNYLYFYDYIRNILVSYLNKKNSVSLSLIEFEVLLNKMDKELFTSQSSKLIDNALYSIADFMNTGTNANKVSVQSLEVFFKERNLIDYLFKLRRTLPGDVKNQKYTVEDIRTIIYSTSPIDKPVKPVEEEKEYEVQKEDFSEIFMENEPEQPEFEEPEDIIIDKFSEPDVEPEKSTADLLNEINNSYELAAAEPEEDNTIEEEIIIIAPDDDIISQFDSDLKSLEELEKEITDDKGEIELDISQKENLDEFYDFGNDIDNTLLNKDEFSIDKDKEKPGKDNYKEKNFKDEFEDELRGNTGNNFIPKKNTLPNDLYSYLKDKEIDKIVKAVFDDDKEDFAITMDRITECISYDEATEILKSVFLTYRVNPYSREAVTLTNAVANYFNQG
jgi:hypothetical protein